MLAGSTVPSSRAPAAGRRRGLEDPHGHRGQGQHREGGGGHGPHERAVVLLVLDHEVVPRGGLAVELEQRLEHGPALGLEGLEVEDVLADLVGRAGDVPGLTDGHPGVEAAQGPCTSARTRAVSGRSEARMQRMALIERSRVPR